MLTQVGLVGQLWLGFLAVSWLAVSWLAVSLTYPPFI